MAPARHSSACSGQVARPRPAHSPPWRDSQGPSEAQNPSPHGMDAAELASQVAAHCGLFGVHGPGAQGQLQGESKARRSRGASPAKCSCGRDALDCPGPGNEGACGGGEPGAGSREGPQEAGSGSAGSSPRGADSPGAGAGSRRACHGASRSTDFDEDQAQAQRRLAFLGPNYWAWGHGFTDWVRENKVRGRWDALVSAQSPSKSGNPVKASALSLFIPASPPPPASTDKMQEDTLHKEGSLGLAMRDSQMASEGTCEAADPPDQEAGLDSALVPTGGPALLSAAESPTALMPEDAEASAVPLEGSQLAQGEECCSRGASLERELSFGIPQMAKVPEDSFADALANLVVPDLENASAAQSRTPEVVPQRSEQQEPNQGNADMQALRTNRPPRATRNIRVPVPLNVDGLLSPRHQRRADRASAQVSLVPESAPVLTIPGGQAAQDQQPPAQRTRRRAHAPGFPLPQASSSPDLSADAQRWVQRWVDPSASPPTGRKPRVPRGERGIRLQSWGAKSRSMDALVQAPEKGLDAGSLAWQSRASGFLTPQARGTVVQQEGGFPWSPEAQAAGSGESSPLKSSLKSASSPRLWASGERSSRKVQFNETQAVRFIPSRKELRRLEERAQASSQKGE